MTNGNSFNGQNTYRHLLPRADDFGASPGTNEAILEAVHAGFIRNVGVMAPAPYLQHRLEDLKSLQENISIGLHATINSEWDRLRWGPVLPAGQAASLVTDDGTFLESPNQTDKVGKLAEILAEIAAQLDKVRSLGLNPRYIDSHMGFPWIAGVDQALAEFAKGEGLVYDGRAQVPKIRLSAEDMPVDPLLEILGQMEAAQASHAVWVFHPARRDPISELFYPKGAAPSTRVAEARDREYRLLTNSAFVESFLSHQTLKLSRYDELPGQ